MTAQVAALRAKRPKWLNLAFAALTLLFPLFALLLVRPIGPLAVTLGLIALLVLRSLTGFGKSAPIAINLAALAAAAALGALTFIDANFAMRIYPVLMNAAMLAVFAYSLIKPPSIIERFARLVDPNLPESGVRYTRRVTWVWCVFFVLNGTAALWTAIAASLELWAFYNGVLSYLLMGLLLGGEFLVRGFVRVRSPSGPAAR